MSGQLEKGAIEMAVRKKGAIPRLRSIFPPISQISNLRLSIAFKICDRRHF